MMLLNKLWAGGALATLLTFAPNAGATLQLTLSSGATTITVSDNAPGDFNPAAGQITYIGPVGNWSLNVTTGTVGTNPVLDLSSVDTLSGAGTGANALTLKFSETGLSGPESGFLSSVGGTLSGAGSLTYHAYVDSSNTLNGMGTPIGSLLSFGPGGAFSGGTAGGSVGTGLYSATEVVVLSATNRGGTSSFDAAIDVVPEPASVLLLGGVLFFSAFAIRRKAARAERLIRGFQPSLQQPGGAQPSRASRLEDLPPGRLLRSKRNEARPGYPANTATCAAAALARPAILYPPSNSEITRGPIPNLQHRASEIREILVGERESPQQISHAGIEARRDQRQLRPEFLHRRHQRVLHRSQDLGAALNPPERESSWSCLFPRPRRFRLRDPFRDKAATGAC